MLAEGMPVVLALATARSSSNDNPFHHHDRSSCKRDCITALPIV